MTDRELLNEACATLGVDTVKRMLALDVTEIKALTAFCKVLTKTDDTAAAYKAANAVLRKEGRKPCRARI